MRAIDGVAAREPRGGICGEYSGGVEGKEGRETVNNWFKIERELEKEENYKIVFCPTVVGILGLRL